MRIYISLLLSIFLTACSEELPEAINPINDGDLEIIQAIETHSFEINSDPLSIPDEQLEIFSNFSYARIIGLGEATHGTREFFKMKHRIFQYLVQNYGFDAFLLDMAEARIFNDWVQWRRHDDLTPLMKDYMIFWTWKTQEVKALLEWIRSYNEGKSESEMIGFYGVDVQFPKYDLDQLADIIRGIDREVADSLLKKNEKYRQINNLYKNNLTDDLINEIRAGIQLAKDIVEIYADEIKLQR